MKFKRIFLPIMISAILIIILPFIITPLYNNWCLDRFASQLLSLPLPEETNLLEDIKQCVKLSGNGNGMDFLTILIIQSDNNLKELELYYNGFSMAEARSDNIEFSDPPVFVTYCGDNQLANITRWKLTSPVQRAFPRGYDRKAGISDTIECRSE